MRGRRGRCHPRQQCGSGRHCPGPRPACVVRSQTLRCKRPRLLHLQAPPIRPATGIPCSHAVHACACARLHGCIRNRRFTAPPIRPARLGGPPQARARGRTCAAPLTRPAMSQMSRKAGWLALGFTFSTSQSKRQSGTVTRATLGSIVQKGKFSAVRDARQGGAGWAAMAGGQASAARRCKRRRGGCNGSCSGNGATALPLPTRDVQLAQCIKHCRLPHIGKPHDAHLE